MNSRIKLSARAALSGSYLRIVPTVTAVMFLLLLFSLANATVSFFFPVMKGYPMIILASVTLLLALICISPLRLSAEIRHIMLASGRRNADKVKIGVSGMLKSCGMCALLFFLKAFWFAIFEILPFSAATVFFLFWSQESVSLRAFCSVWAGIIILALAGFGFFLFYIQKYSASMFYLACYEDMGVFDAVQESVRKNRGKCGEILLFKLGFLPWFILCIGIAPALFVIPYYKQSITCRFLGGR